MVSEAEDHRLLQLLSLQENCKFPVILLHGKLVRRIAGAQAIARLNVGFNLHSESSENLRKGAEGTFGYPVELCLAIGRAIPGFAVVFPAILHFAVVVAHVPPSTRCDGLWIGVDKCWLHSEKQ